MSLYREERLNEVFAFLVEESVLTDATLESAIKCLRVALLDGGDLGRNENLQVLDQLWSALATHRNVLHTLNLLDVSGSEAALREAERVRAKRRNTGKK